MVRVLETGAFRRKFALPALVLALTASLAGCAVTGNSLPEVVDSDALVTNSVVEKGKPEGISETDAEVIKQTVASAELSKLGKPLAWTNPDTGSSGAIVAIDKFMGKHGQRCRGFKTTVDSFMGIAFYNGETCQISSDKWVLSWFKSSDES